MKLKRSPVALAAVVLAWLGLPQIVDAQQVGGGGGRSAAGYGGSGHGTPGNGGGGHGASSYGGRGPSTSGNGGGGHGGVGSSGFTSYGGSFYDFAGRHHRASVGSSSQSSLQSNRQGTSGGKPDDYESSRLSGINLASNASLQHATLTRQNAFFDRSKFGARESKLGWLDHYGNRYSYRWHRSIFWPYFFGDYFSYILWPHGYFNTFWGYGLDVVLLSAFWPYGQQLVYDEPKENNSVYSGDLYYNGEVYLPDRSREGSGELLAPLETCSGFAPGVGALPIQQLEKIIDATTDQRAALSDLKVATAKASDILKHSCSSETPLTPVSRLDAMQRRLKAMAEANGVVKAPLIHLYGLFSDAQKQQLEASALSNVRQVQASRAKDNLGEMCSDQAEFTNVPADLIGSTIQLSEAQKQELEKLKTISAKASAGLKASCPSTVPDLIQGRLDGAQMRIAALSQAIDAVRPAAHDFYASLTDEQKAALVIQSIKRTASRR